MNDKRRQDDADAELFWSRLTYTDKCNAFHYVVSKIFEGEIKVKGSYRYVLYDIFKFGPDMYRRGVDCGFMALHNSIMNDEQFAEANKWMLGADQPAQQLIHCKHKRENGGVCPHHNLQCGWPKCNELEQPAQQEPVKIAHKHEWFRTGEMKVGQMRCISCGTWGQEEMPQRTWVGLTDEERYLGDARSEEEIEYARAIEAKLKGKNT